VPPRRPMGTIAGVDARFVVGGLAVVALVAAAFVLSGGLGSKPSGSPAPGATSRWGATCPTSQPASLPAGQTRTVTITTPKGNIVIKVDGSLSPIAAGNFVALASCGYYDGVVFHRIVPDFVIQGGDPDGTGSGPGPGYTIKDEPITTAYHRGTVAMARTPNADSQGSQFFIVLADSAASQLASASPGYAIFGEVTSGMDVVDAIAAAAGGVELPTDPIVMTQVTVAP
jgi:cyclophilin family peptidyl-prolyl cis-trans isomerase